MTEWRQRNLEILGELAESIESNGKVRLTESQRAKDILSKHEALIAGIIKDVISELEASVVHCNLPFEATKRFLEIKERWLRS